MKIETITSFNEHYWNLIGRESVESWLRYWPQHLSMTCYTEDFEMPKYDRVATVDFSCLAPDYFALQKEEFHPSVKRFAKKAYSVIHAMHHSTADWIVWLDADVISTDYLPEKLLLDILNPRHLAVHLGVTYETTKQGETGNWFVPETGFFAINRQHEKFEQFRQIYTDRYRNRDQSGLRRFYDNDVYGIAVRETKAKYFDLCGHFEKPYKTPLRHTILGPYIKHYKAKHSKKTYATARQ